MAHDPLDASKRILLRTAEDDAYDRPVKLQIACMNLRHKLMYVDARHAERGLVDNSSDTRVFWCAKTQRSLGPDGEPVSPGECSMGRSCYCGR